MDALSESHVSTDLAAELGFDWNGHRSSYGGGAECLAELERALRTPDPAERHELLEASLRFVCVDGVLSHAAPAYAAKLIMSSGPRPSWSVFAVLSVLARATWTTLVPGYWPLPRVAVDYGVTGPAERLARQDEQHRIASRVRGVFRDGRDRLLAAAAAQPENERLHVWSLLSWATPGFGDPAADAILALSPNPAAECGALLFDVSGAVMKAGSGLFSDARRGDDGVSLDAALECLDGERSRVSALEGLPEFPWYDGSRSAAVVALVAESPRSFESKRLFFERAMELGPPTSSDSLLPAPPTGATLAAWCLLAHSVPAAPGALLGPEDLDERPTAALRAVASNQSSWLTFAQHWLPYYGISDPAYLRDLISYNLPVLAENVTDVWSGSLGRDSVWKWIHRVGLDTPPASAERYAAARLCASTLQAHLGRDKSALVAAFCLERPELRDVATALLSQ